MTGQFYEACGGCHYFERKLDEADKEIARLRTQVRDYRSSIVALERLLEARSDIEEV